MLDQKIQLVDIPSQLQLIDRLQHLVRFTSSFSFISGDNGSGKTIIIQRLLSLDIDTNQSLLTCTPGIRANKARDVLLSQLVKKPLFNADDNLGESLFRMLGESNSDLMLVVDDAHYLPQDLVSELWLLLLENRFQGFDHKINVLLFADPTWCAEQVALLSGKTEMPPIEMDIPPLSEQESHQFVRGLLQRADYHTKVENNAAVERKIEACQGLPACLQTLVDTIMNTTAVVEVAKVKNNTQLPLIGLMVLAALLMSGAFYYFIVPATPEELETTGSNDSLAMELLDEPAQALTISEQTSSKADNETTTALVSSTADELVASWPDNQPLPSEVKQSDLELDSLADPRKRVTVPEKVIAKFGADDDATANQELTSEQIDADAVTVQSVQQLQQVLAQPLAVPASGANTTDIVKQEDTAVSGLSHEASQSSATSEGEDVTTPIITLAPALNKPASVAEAQAEQAETVSNTAPATVTPPTAVGFNLTSVAQLKKIPNQHYSLQLAAVSSLPVLKAFVKEHNIEQTATYFKINRNGKVAYLVVYGEYRNRREAMNAIASLPTNLRTLQPWAKGYKLIQQEAID